MTMSKLGRFGLRWLAPALGILALTVLSDRFVKTSKNTGPNDAELRNLLAAYGAENVTIDRTMRDFKMPQEFEWKGRPGSTSQTAALFGDPAKPGLYIAIPNGRSKDQIGAEDQHFQFRRLWRVLEQSRVPANRLSDRCGITASGRRAYGQLHALLKERIQGRAATVQGLSIVP